MTFFRRLAPCAPALLLLLATGCSLPLPGTARPDGSVSVYEPSSPAVVSRMLDLAGVGPADRLYDVGSGDGRIVIAAARRGAWATGIELVPELVAGSRARAATLDLPGSARFVEGDAALHDFSDATVVTMFLPPAATERFAVLLRGQLRPGARIVSHASPAGDWEPARTVVLPPDGFGRRRSLYLWVVGPRAAAVPAPPSPLLPAR